MEIFWQVTFAVFLVSLIPFLSFGFLFIPKRHLKNILNVLIAFAIGVMLADVFLHILPDIYANTENVVPVDPNSEVAI